MKRYHVSIAFDQIAVVQLPNGLLCLKHPIEDVTFMIYLRLRGVDIFWLLLILLQDPRPEPDGLTPQVVDGEDDPTSKSVVNSGAIPFFFQYETGFKQDILLET